MKPRLGFKEHLLLIFITLKSDKTDRASGQEKFNWFSLPDQNRGKYLYLKMGLNGKPAYLFYLYQKPIISVLTVY